MIGAAICFGLLELLPVNFSYWVFGLLLFLTGLSMASFGSPNRTGVMNSLPAEHRGAGSGMNTTFQNSAQVFSIGIFFTLMIIGLSSALSNSLSRGLIQHGVPVAKATQAAHLPPVSTLFAAFLGYNPIQHLIGSATLSHIPAAQRAVLLGHSFFPMLISAPFRAGLHAALDFAILASLLAAVASWTRGKRYLHSDPQVQQAGVRTDGGTDSAPAGVERDGRKPIVDAGVHQDVGVHQSVPEVTKR
jgi:hypothetical protein